MRLTRAALAPPLLRLQAQVRLLLPPLPPLRQPVQRHMVPSPANRMLLPHWNVYWHGRSLCRCVLRFLSVLLLLSLLPVPQQLLLPWRVAPTAANIRVLSPHWPRWKVCSRSPSLRRCVPERGGVRRKGSGSAGTAAAGPLRTVGLPVGSAPSTRDGSARRRRRPPSRVWSMVEDT